MTQNIYDNDEFFARYSQLGRSVEGLAGAAEWPALRAMLPELGGRQVLDLGCGFGWFCRWAREQGAADVLGMDVSEKMLARARATTADPAIRYQQADLEQIELAAVSYDLIYSSLTLHYIVQLPRLFSQIATALRPGGHFVFSAEHPIFTAPRDPAWSTDGAGRRVWPIDSYLIEGPRARDWLAKGVIKQHRTLGTHLNLLLASGFHITHVEEWCPTDQQISARPELAIERERPMFVLVSACKA